MARAPAGRTVSLPGVGRAALRRKRLDSADAAAPYLAKRLECAGWPALSVGPRRNAAP